MTLSFAMRNLSQAIKTKTGAASNKTAKKIYGLIIAPSIDHPGFLSWFSTEFDKLPRGMKPDWYAGAVRGLVGEFESERRANEARGRVFVDGEKQFKEVLEEE